MKHLVQLPVAICVSSLQQVLFSENEDKRPALPSNEHLEARDIASFKNQNEGYLAPHESADFLCTL